MENKNTILVALKNHSIESHKFDTLYDFAEFCVDYEYDCESKTVIYEITNNKFKRICPDDILKLVEHIEEDMRQEEMHNNGLRVPSDFSPCNC